MYNSSYVAVVGEVKTEPKEHKADRIVFKLKDHNSLPITCLAPFQLAHHIRQNDYIMCYGRILIQDNYGTVIMLESIHEQDKPIPEPDHFELGGAL